MPAPPHRPDAAPAAPAGLRRIRLADYRSYAALDLSLSGAMIVLTGENGAGKTNLLEAISFLTPGRGLRRADLAECARKGGAGGWAVSVDLAMGEGLAAGEDTLQLGTGAEAPVDGAPLSRKCRIARAPAGSAAAFAEHLRVVWLTPAMDGLFDGPAGERRRFLDRLVLAVDSGHGARVNALERALRNRNRLLEEGGGNARWLDAAEHEAAEIGVAVAAARVETVARLAALIDADRRPDAAFPFATLALQGEVEALVAAHPALEAEERYRTALFDNRRRDAQAGRTLIGPQTADLAVRHGPKDVAAAQASTGEQKALLVGLVLAHALLVATMSGLKPIILLDEIAAHFDPRRRAALFEALETLGGQIFMTGADPAAFAELAGRAQMFNVEPGRIVALATR